jgi:hypothetical protein
MWLMLREGFDDEGYDRHPPHASSTEQAKIGVRLHVTSAPVVFEEAAVEFR